MTVSSVKPASHDDEIKKINHPSVAFIMASDFPLSPLNKWLQANGPLHLITRIGGLAAAATRWCNVFLIFLLDCVDYEKKKILNAIANKQTKQKNLLN